MYVCETKQKKQNIHLNQPELAIRLGHVNTATRTKKNTLFSLHFLLPSLTLKLMLKNCFHF